MLARIAVALLLISMIACHKFIDIDDLWHKHNPNCRVEQIGYRQSSSPDTNTARFYYNNKGYPTAVNFDAVGTGRPNLLFRYDNKGRLVDFIAPYTNNNYEQWFHYEHDAHGRIIADSLFTFGAFINGEPSRNALIKAAAWYEYDMYDRIKKVTRAYENFTIADEYLYNHQGNLEIHNRYTNGNFSGADTFYYDNKVNIHRTNRIWMFIDRNYSKNNPHPAEHYNQAGLPTRYRLPGSETISFDFNFIYSIELEHSDIKYHCK